MIMFQTAGGGPTAGFAYSSVTWWLYTWRFEWNQQVSWTLQTGLWLQWRETESSIFGELCERFTEIVPPNADLIHEAQSFYDDWADEARWEESNDNSVADDNSTSTTSDIVVRPEISECCIICHDEMVCGQEIMLYACGHGCCMKCEDEHGLTSTDEWSRRCPMCKQISRPLRQLYRTYEDPLTEYEEGSESDEVETDAESEEVESEEGSESEEVESEEGSESDEVAEYEEGSESDEVAEYEEGSESKEVETDAESDEVAECECEEGSNSDEVAECEEGSESDAKKGAPRRIARRKIARNSSDEDLIDFSLGSSSSEEPIEFHIFVKTPYNSTVVLTNVKATSTIDNIKAKLQEGDGFLSDSYRLIFAGKYCKGEKTLQYYNIRVESTLLMMPGLPGGSPKKRLRAVAATEMRQLEHDPPVIAQLLQMTGWNAKEFLGALTRDQAMEFYNQLEKRRDAEHAVTTVLDTMPLVRQMKDVRFHMFRATCPDRLDM
jgi:hypothetical protein